MAADRISELPVDILLLILSFLPTEDAVVTSLVSKRWRPLWLSVLTLNFDRERYLQRRRQYGFTDFICATIQARGSHPPIKQFCLACDPRESHAKEILLNYALLGEVETVEIENFPPHELPSSILNCTKLVVLKLCYSSFHKDFSSVYLPSLKTLHLKVIGFVKPQCFMDFLYGCPILEDLQANYGFFYGDCSFEGEFKSLSKLVSAVVCNLQGFHIPVQVFSNVKFLTLDQCDDELLQCDDEDIPMFPNLIHLELICEDNCDGLKWNSVLDILNYSPNLQKFVLQFPYSFREDWPNPQFVSECFSSQLTKCVIKIYSRRANQMTFAKYVMQNSTSLQTMTIFCSSYPYRSRDEDWKKYMLLELASCPMSSATCELLLK